MSRRRSPVPGHGRFRGRRPDPGRHPISPGRPDRHQRPVVETASDVLVRPATIDDAEAMGGSTTAWSRVCRCDAGGVSRRPGRRRAPTGNAVDGEVTPPAGARVDVLVAELGDAVVAMSSFGDAEIGPTIRPASSGCSTPIPTPSGPAPRRHPHRGRRRLTDHDRAFLWVVEIRLVHDPPLRFRQRTPAGVDSRTANPRSPRCRPFAPRRSFADLPGYPFAPNYVEIDDTGGGTCACTTSTKAGPVAHARRAVGYLYRTMIPPLAAAGNRGSHRPRRLRSERQTHRTADYTYARHVVDGIGALRRPRSDRHHLLRPGLGWPDRHPARRGGAGQFVLITGNTMLPTGDHPASEAFLNWQHFSQTTEVFPVGMILNGATTTDLSPEVIAAYGAPFPDDVPGRRRIRRSCPPRPTTPRRAEPGGVEVLEQFEKPGSPRSPPGPRHRRRRSGVPGPGARTTSHVDRGWRPLPPGGPGTRSLR